MSAIGSRVGESARPGARVSRAGRGSQCAGVRAAAAAALVAAGLGVACAPAPEAPRHLLLVTIDTLRADQLGAYGSDRGLTPNLDRFASGATLFERAYAPAPFTLASIAALLTARYPEEVGIETNYSAVAGDVPTLATWLSAHGFETRAAVSNVVLDRSSGLDRGFARYDDELRERERVRPLPERTAEATTDAALALQAGAPHDAPLFLWVHYQDPHGPYTPPPGYREAQLAAERERVGDAELPLARGDRGVGGIPRYQALDGHRDVAFYRAGYAGEIRWVDEQIGRLLSELDARGFLDRAVAIVTADHGEGLGEGDYWFSHGEFLYPPQLRVPLIVSRPGGRGERRSDVASLLDVAPTAAALLGVDPVATADGLRGRDLFAAGASRGAESLYVSTLATSSVPRFGLVRGRDLLLVGDGARRVVAAGDEDASAADPDALARELAALRASLSSRAPVQRAFAEGDLQRLRALGYAEPAP